MLRNSASSSPDAAPKQLTFKFDVESFENYGELEDEAQAALRTM